MSKTPNNDNSARAPEPAEIIANECVAVRLRILTRAVNKIYNDALRPYGLTVSQMNILVALLRLGEAHQQLICQALYLDKSTLSRDLNRMRQEGWVEERAGIDERTRLLKVTPRGKDLIDQAFEAWQAAQRDALALLGEQDTTGIDRLTRGLKAQHALRP
jgi:DNA-binding MarR family transcriptional regulator